MTTYPSPLSPSPALTDEATLEVAVDSLLEHLPIEMEGGYTSEDLFEILLRAASRGDSIEHTVRQMEGVPSGNGVRYHLDKLSDMATVEHQLNAALQSRIPPKIAKKRHRLAIDLHLIPYYGTPNEAEAPYIYRSQAKSGTTRFFAYATIYVICRNKRVTLAIHAVHQHETLVATVTTLLAMLHPLRVGVKRLYLDRGFYSVPVIRWLKALNIPFMMPAVVRGKTGGTRQLLQGRKSYATHYTLNSAQYGSVTCQMRVICNYYKGVKGKHGIQYSLYVVHRVTVALHQLHYHYKDRFGIESSYRIKNQYRIRTTSKNPVTRLLFVALAFILVNLWVYLLWFFVSRTQRGGRVVYASLFRLKTMLEFLSQAVERHFPAITSIYLPALE
ncbi:MAG TPA: ISH3 family transposase [Coleofasciculaceae cyanobacterium]|jgi:putative transposase